MSGNKSETTESGKTTLPHERLIEAYNRRFEIQEEIDVMTKTTDGYQSRKFDQLTMQLTYVDNIISIGESDFDKKRAATVGKLFAVLRTLQHSNN
ncbi:hypothetical protein GCK72_025216 [Caenorhabditis remanei]|uniref:Uncharacterized protein n=1 Tax=Caenorhabditis remanei TaxID=31234 RepID=A0A6A5G2I8_CAERE|nr:hypothetical protein GCK72_025216 [Caenorhabditis remanei]KAF1748749.1 hypothetical protein GCK72_025216 [Caenorhabditis remanei]